MVASKSKFILAKPAPAPCPRLGYRCGRLFVYFYKSILPSQLVCTKGSAITRKKMEHYAIKNSTNGTATTDTSSSMYIGASLSCIGNLLISVALNVQKHVHNKLGSEAEAGREVPSYTKVKLWWVGISLMIFGELGNFGAYFFAPAVLVAPLGTVTVISNSIIAPCWLGETFRYRDGIGVLFASVGAGVIVSCAPEEHDTAETAANLWKHYISSTRVIVYCCLMIGLGASMYALLRKGVGQKHILIPLVLTAVLGSFTILSVKALSMLLNETFQKNGHEQFTTSPLIYFIAVILAGSAIYQVKFLNYTMQFFDSTQVVPTFFVLFTLGAISVGGVMYNDFRSMSTIRIVGFILGIASTFVGVFLITGGHRQTYQGTEILVNDELSSEGKVEVNCKLQSFGSGGAGFNRGRTYTHGSLSSFNPWLSQGLWIDSGSRINHGSSFRATYRPMPTPQTPLIG